MKFNDFQIDLLDARLAGRQFDFVMNDAVFQQIDGLVTKGEVHAQVTCTKATSHEFIFSIHSEGVVCVPCDRCLADLELRIETTDELTVRLGDTYEDDGDVLTVPSNEAQFDLSLPIYEFIVLNMPIKRTHGPGKCDAAMMQEYSKHQAARSSREGGEDEDSTNEPDALTDDSSDTDFSSDAAAETPVYDSRWEALAQLKNNL